MNTRTLEQFVSLANHLHFGQAASASNISVSALSRNIRQLEDEVGVVLFDRDNRSVSLTEKGQLLLKSATELLAQWSAIRDELTGEQKLTGEISLYCSVTASHSLLFNLLNRFRPDYPGIDIKLHTGDPDHAIQRVTDANEQVAIAAQPDTLPRGLLFKPITESPLVFIAPARQQHHVPASLPASAQQWSQVPMILSEGGIARRRVNAWFRKKGIKPRIYAQVSGNEAIVSMVGLGLGIGVVPQIVLDNSPLADQVTRLNVKPALQAYNVGLVTRKKNLSNPLVDAFWRLV